MNVQQSPLDLKKLEYLAKIIDFSILSPKLNQLMSEINAELTLSPEGHVYLDENPQANEFLSSHLFEKIKNLFTKDSTTGLLHLGIQDFKESLPPSFLFSSHFARQFIEQVCKLIHLVVQKKQIKKND